MKCRGMRFGGQSGGRRTGQAALLLAGAGVAALSAGAAWAQGAETPPEAVREAVRLAQLRSGGDRVVVTATRTEVSAEDAPVTVSVITDEDIEAIVATDIKDLVRFEPGVSVRSAPSRPTAALAATGRDGNSGFNIRGLEGNRVLIQTDGIRMPDSFSFGAQAVGRGDYVDLDLLKSVEILRGPSSALYGSDGLAGAVSFTTKDPDDFLGARNFGGRARAAYSSADESVAASIVAAGQSGPLQAMIAYTRREGSEQKNRGTDTSPDARRTAPNPQDIESNSVMGKLVFAPSNTHRLRLTGEYFDRKLESDVLSARAAPAVPPAVLPDTATTRLDVRDDTERKRLSLDYAYRSPDASGLVDRASIAVFYQDSTTRQFSDEARLVAPGRIRDTTFDNRVWGATGQVESAFTTGAVTHRILVGGDFSETRQEGIRDGTVPPVGETFPARPFPVTDYTLAGLFVQDEIGLMDGALLLYPALRYDWYELTPRPDALYTGAAAGQDGSHLSPKLGAVLWATDHFGLFANYAAGFKAPSPSQVNNGFANPLFGYASIPNPDLKPETSDSFEAGARLRGVQAGGAVWSASASAFTAKYEDFIEQVMVGGSFTPMDPAIYQFVNLGEVKISGAEARVQGVWSNGLGAIAAVSYAKGDQESGGVREPLQSIDPWKLVGGLSYDDPAGRFGGQAIVTHSSGKRDSRVAENRPGDARADLFTPPGFTLLDLTAYWNITDAATLRLAVFNVFNEKYWWWSDARGLSATSTILDAYTQPGRNFSASVVYRF